MEDYNFWADLLASYRASPDIVKALWVLVPLTFTLGFAALAVGVALRMTESRDRLAEQATPADANRHETGPRATTPEGHLIEMDAEKPYVSRRLPSR